jgi:uncharacterized protein
MTRALTKESAMTTRDEPWPQGTPCWVDVTVPDVPAARGFYAGLFGWQMPDTGPEADGCTIARLSGRPAAGVGSIAPGPRTSPMWTTYLAVDDVDTVAARATRAGGQVVTRPADVTEQGRVAVVADPTGAAFGLWQARSHRGAEIINEPGALTWNECMTRDYEQARRFYTEVFGYDLEEVGDGSFRYSVLHLGGHPVGGLGQLAASLPADLPPHWMSCFAVADADATLTRAADLNARVRMPAQDTPYGRTAVLEGPQGEVFAVIAS